MFTINFPGSACLSLMPTLWKFLPVSNANRVFSEPKSYCSWLERCQRETIFWKIHAFFLFFFFPLKNSSKTRRLLTKHKKWFKMCFWYFTRNVYLCWKVICYATMLFRICRRGGKSHKFLCIPSWKLENNERLLKRLGCPTVSQTVLVFFAVLTDFMCQRNWYAVANDWIGKKCKHFLPKVFHVFFRTSQKSNWSLKRPNERLWLFVVHKQFCVSVEWFAVVMYYFVAGKKNVKFQPTAFFRAFPKEKYSK